MPKAKTRTRLGHKDVTLKRAGGVHEAALLQLAGLQRLVHKSHEIQAVHPEEAQQADTHDGGESGT